MLLLSVVAGFVGVVMRAFLEGGEDDGGLVGGDVC